MKQILETIENNEQVFIGTIKGLISSIPFIGGAIIGALDGHLNQRLEDTIKQLSIGIEKLGEEKIDKKFIMTEEGIDLFIKCIRTRLKHRSQQKAKFIYGLLIESNTIDRDLRFSTDLKEKFLNIIDKLSDEEMIFLKDYINGKYKEKSQKDIYQMSDKEGIALDGLLAENLLRPDDTWVKHIVETKLFCEFLAYLKVIAKEYIF